MKSKLIEILDNIIIYIVQKTNIITYDIKDVNCYTLKNQIHFESPLKGKYYGSGVQDNGFYSGGCLNIVYDNLKFKEFDNIFFGDVKLDRKIRLHKVFQIVSLTSRVDVIQKLFSNRNGVVISIDKIDKSGANNLNFLLSITFSIKSKDLHIYNHSYEYCKIFIESILRLKNFNFLGSQNITNYKDNFFITLNAEFKEDLSKNNINDSELNKHFQIDKELKIKEKR